MKTPSAMSVIPNSSATTKDWRSTSLASASRLAPMSCAVWTEKPLAIEMQSPLRSQVEVDTRPMEAEACAPKLPTMAESMYCIAMELSSARIAGTLRAITFPICTLHKVSRWGSFCKYAFSAMYPSTLF